MGYVMRCPRHDDLLGRSAGAVRQLIQIVSGRAVTTCAQVLAFLRIIDHFDLRRTRCPRNDIAVLTTLDISDHVCGQAGGPERARIAQPFDISVSVLTGFPYFSYRHFCVPRVASQECVCQSMTNPSCFGAQKTANQSRHFLQYGVVIPMSTPSSKFPEQLEKARRLRNLNQAELAKASGLQASAISHFETGSRKPSFDNLRKLADALSVTTDFLLGRTDEIDGSVGNARIHRDRKST